MGEGVGCWRKEGVCGLMGREWATRTHSLDEMQQQKLLLHPCILLECGIAPVKSAHLRAAQGIVISAKTSSHDRSYPSNRSHLAIDNTAIRSKPGVYCIRGLIVRRRAAGECRARGRARARSWAAGGRSIGDVTSRALTNGADETAHRSMPPIPF
ncbi:hypothetical protein EVAR_102990_1 [Eumeta japonica]|uniref:Uncharacterized protein n=1 Tax=Eumeta variegata TaxID=151549 RepID=A0A4C1UQV5_EUMVA|nr:hypothetical protein EVAR_102990_1 [Eumeta japonica]